MVTTIEPPYPTNKQLDKIIQKCAKQGAHIELLRSLDCWHNSRESTAITCLKDITDIAEDYDYFTGVVYFNSNLFFGLIIDGDLEPRILYGFTFWPILFKWDTDWNEKENQDELQ